MINGMQGIPKIKPRVDLYIRGANSQDIKRMCDLYNDHITTSISTPECEPLTEHDIALRIKQIRASKLPCLVAYQRGGKVVGRKERNPDGPIILPDKLVGFAFANDYNDAVGAYRFTASLEVFVDNHSFMQGVASCLMDKLLGLLDPTFGERGGFDIEGDEAEGIGASRLIKNLVMNVAFDRLEVLEWKKRWLEHWLGFKQVGMLEGIGDKGGKAYVFRFNIRSGVPQG